MKKKEAMKEYYRDLTKLAGLGRCSWKSDFSVERVILTKMGNAWASHMQSLHCGGR